jgi:hypothetical protein
LLGLFLLAGGLLCIAAPLGLANDSGRLQLWRARPAPAPNVAGPPGARRTEGGGVSGLVPFAPLPKMEVTWSPRRSVRGKFAVRDEGIQLTSPEPELTTYWVVAQDPDGTVVFYDEMADEFGLGEATPDGDLETVEFGAISSAFSWRDSTGPPTLSSRDQSG